MSAFGPKRTPRGNIGPVGEALASKLGVRGVPACPRFQLPGARSTGSPLSILELSTSRGV
jgi:hypothetical protein